MYGPDSVFDVEADEYQVAEWRRWDLEAARERLLRPLAGHVRPGVAKVLKALRVRRLFRYLVAAVVLGPAK